MDTRYGNLAQTQTIRNPRDFKRKWCALSRAEANESGRDELQASLERHQAEFRVRVSCAVLLRLEMFSKRARVVGSIYNRVYN